jgi:hypothetical protein
MTACGFPRNVCLSLSRLVISREILFPLPYLVMATPLSRSILHTSEMSVGCVNTLIGSHPPANTTQARCTASNLIKNIQ